MYFEDAEMRVGELEPQTRAVKRLVAAVLHRACLDYANARALGGRREQMNLETWFNEGQYIAGKDGKLSFPWICEQLDIAPDQFRRKLYENWRDVAHTQGATAERKLWRADNDESTIEIEASVRQGVQRPAGASQEPLPPKPSTSRVREKERRPTLHVRRRPQEDAEGRGDEQQQQPAGSVAVDEQRMA